MYGFKELFAKKSRNIQERRWCHNGKGDVIYAVFRDAYGFDCGEKYAGTSNIIDRDGSSRAIQPDFLYRSMY